MKKRVYIDDLKLEDFHYNFLVLDLHTQDYIKEDATLRYVPAIYGDKRVVSVVFEDINGEKWHKDYVTSKCNKGKCKLVRRYIITE